jgi:amidase
MPSAVSGLTPKIVVMTALQLPTIAETRRLMATRKASATELLEEAAGRISAHNSTLNALPTLCLDRAREESRRVDRLLSGRGKSSTSGLGPLAGQPYCAKDMFDTQGVRTTYGSVIFKDHVPTADAEIVARIRRAGAILVGKSNTPEFAAGSQTFNRVFGATRNPFDTERTCGGSTGGGAVALASGMVSIADGSDLAASLRNPASFCGVAGMRPSSHLEPRLQPGRDPFNTLSMVGPLARSIADLREIFLAIFDPAGCAPVRDLSHWVELRDHQDRDRRWGGKSRKRRKLPRIGWAPSWDRLPVEPAVSLAMDEFAARASRAGIHLLEGFPRLPDVRSAFLTLRGEYFVAELGELYESHRQDLKDTIIWNIEQGLGLAVTDIVRAHGTRATARACIEQYMDTHQLDAIAGPSSQVLPFGLDMPYVEQIGTTRLETYIDWLASNFFVTVAGLPAISMPAAVATAPGSQTQLPVGLQLIGRWGDDMHLLDIAQAIEETL